MEQLVVVVRPLDRPGDLGWVVMAHGEMYASQFGFDNRFEALVARIAGEYGGGHDPVREAAWIAESEGARVGCVFVVADDASTARLRVLLVDPAVRGRGVGGRLVDTAVGFAREAGYDRMVLWTNDVLTAAIRLYLKAGFVLTESEPHRSYGAELVGQTYELDLR